LNQYYDRIEHNILPVLASHELFESSIFTNLLSTGYSLDLYDPSLIKNLDLFIDSKLNGLIFAHSSYKEYLDNFTVLDENNLILSKKQEIDSSNQYISFNTSGTTGKPCLMIKTQENIISEIIELSKTFDFTDSDSFLSSVPFCHIYGFLWGNVLPRYLNTSSLFTKSLSDTRLKIESDEHTVWIATPIMIEAIFGTGNAPSTSRLKKIISSGAKLNPNLALEIHDSYKIEVIEIYGSSETGGIGYRYPYKEDGFKLFDSVQLSLNEDSGFRIKSPHVSKYCKIQNKLELLLDESGFFSSSDIGSYINQKLYLNGRMDRIVKINGKRIHIDIIENMIRAADIDEIEKMIIIYHSDILKLFYIPKINKKTEAHIVRFKVKNALPSFLQSIQVHPLEFFPVLPNHKIDIQKLKELYFN
jgi:long-subunit acyl-CoA synthetase (AMP-forming)